MAWTIWVALGALLSGLGVGLGAFGAHALKGRLTESMLVTFEVGVRYQMYHALALIACGLVMSRFEAPLVSFAAVAIAIGVVLFSGSLYLISLADMKQLGIVTPIGGLLMIIGWFILVWALAKAYFTSI